MTSSYKDQTGNTPPSLSGASTEAKAQPSAQSVRTDNTKPSTQTMKVLSKGTRPDATTDKRILLSEIFKTTVTQLERHGLIKRYKLLSKDGTTVKEIRIVLSPDTWTTEMDLK